jgi:lipopolysaccharide export system permease protein
MKIIHRYILSDFLMLFFSSIAVITFVMSIGALFKVTDLLASGASAKPLLTIFLTAMPRALSLAIPLATLIAVLLLFGRLSSDSEITAMKSCGISLYYIAAPLLITSIISAIVCLMIHDRLAPWAHERQRIARQSMRMLSPTGLLEEGRYINDLMDNVLFYVGRKMRDGQLYDVRIVDKREPGFVREVRARTATVTTDKKGYIVVNLKQATISPFSKDSSSPAYCEEMPFTLDRLDGSTKTYEKREDNMTFAELIQTARELEQSGTANQETGRKITPMFIWVDFNKRITLSLSCIAFTLLGIPLGIKAHRKESSIGIALSLLLIMNFYLFIVIAKSMMKTPGLPAHLITWIPVVLSIVAGVWLMRRSR